jgi:hypothetical protein
MQVKEPRASFLISHPMPRAALSADDEAHAI